MNILILTQYNYSMTAPTSYHKVFEPCDQALADMVGMQFLSGA